jgi:hypothetical protein
LSIGVFDSKNTSYLHLTSSSFLRFAFIKLDKMCDFLGVLSA